MQPPPEVPPCLRAARVSWGDCPFTGRKFGDELKRPVDAGHPHPRRDYVSRLATCSMSGDSNHGSPLINSPLTSPWPRSTQQTNVSWRQAPHLDPTNHNLSSPMLRTLSWEDAWVALGWNGGQCWQSRVRAPLSLVYCVFIQNPDESQTKDWRDKALLLSSVPFLHPSPQLTP